MRPAVLCVLVWAVATGCRDVDVVTATYATLAEARAAGAIDRGWIPAGLPSSARDLRAAHDASSTRRWGLFEFDAADEGAVRTLTGSREADLGGVVCDIPARIEWWPLVLRNRIDASVLASAGLDTYRSPDGTLYVAVNWNQRRAYYWTT